MSQYLTMELENEGPARMMPGDLQSGDLFFANNLPYCRHVVDSVSARLGLPSIFYFSEGREEARRQAEVAVYGKPEDELDEDDPEITDETEAEVSRIYYSTGLWFTPEEGLRATVALLKYFVDNPVALQACRYGLGGVPDLAQLWVALQEAATRKRRFRLRFSY